MKEFFRGKYSWQSVYYHYRKWCKDGSWERIWTNLLAKYKSNLDMSSIQLDGTHTPTKRGGQKVAYQGRKKCKTSNILIISDAQGIPLACSDPISGNHNDAYKLEEHIQLMFNKIKKSDIKIKGLFLNADSGFDTKEFKLFCHKNDVFDNIAKNKRRGKIDDDIYSVFDEELYKNRFVIERTNAWLDSFKAILVRFETNSTHWKCLNLIAFSLILLSKL